LVETADAKKELPDEQSKELPKERGKRGRKIESATLPVDPFSSPD
jgi:hypothetical protein